MGNDRCQHRDGAAEVLQVLYEPACRELVELSLAATARSLRADFVVLWLHDGRSLKILGGPDGLRSAKPSCRVEGEVHRCFREGRMIEFDQDSGEDWIRALPLAGSDGRMHGCLAPLRLAGETVGVVGVIRAGEQCFEIVDRGAIEAHTLRLALSLHHCATAPGMRTEWMTAFEDQIGPSVGQHRLNNCPMLLFSGLPKGIHGPTLKALCRWVHMLGTEVTRKEAARALGLSQVTVGRYLSFMVGVGLVRRAVEHRQMGRPTYLYSAEQRCPQLPM